jgi:hypothetical protein
MTLITAEENSVVISIQNVLIDLFFSDVDSRNFYDNVLEDQNVIDVPQTKQQSIDGEILDEDSVG